MTETPKTLHRLDASILRHASITYGPGSGTYKRTMALVDRGLLEQAHLPWLYVITEAGREALRLHEATV